MKHSEPAHFKKNNWAIVYAQSNFNEANFLHESLVLGSTPFGIKVEDPLWVECPKGNQAIDFINPIKADIKSDIKIAVVVLTNKDLKPLIKKALTDKGVISQFVMVALLKKDPK